MWAMFIADPAGKPPRVTANVTVADVMLPAASFVVTNVMLAVPLTPDSAFVTGGTSLAGDNAAVNVGLAAAVGLVVADVEFFVHPAARSTIATTGTDRRFIV